ncbi:MAG: dodecin domain-containing protein [Chlorobi bacterium]|nr:dodecin domain-containing protein [Chlorobiota bacterium]
MVLKVIELMASSEKSWEDATRKAVEKAGKSVNNIKSAWVKDQTVIVKDNKVTEFRVNLKVSFVVD